MKEDFKPIKLEDLNLTPEEMELIAKGAQKHLDLPPEDDKQPNPKVDDEEQSLTS